jgi:peptidoglycan/xylan/chitin deacetylase (PgdA/CDA1 family)
MRRRVFAGLAAIALALMVPATAAQAEPIKVPRGTLVVSFTFDDGWKGQEDAGKVLAERGMSGTFYVNSGQIGYPAYMNLETLTELQETGHEIAGHTVDHEDLDKLTPADAQHQICDDRATLEHLGFRVTSFAYPYGSGDRSARKIVQDCGYSNARATSGLKSATSPGCDSCPYAEELPPDPDYWKIRTSDQDVMSVADLEKQITVAHKSGGGWLELVFHHVCDCPEKGKERITVQDFTELVDWAARKPGIRIADTDEVIGGVHRPIVGQVIDRFDNVNPARGVPEQPAQRAPRYAFHIGWVGIGQGFVIAAGLVLALACVIGWRFHTRDQRYRSSNPGGHA